MAVITKITAQKQNKERFNVFLDKGLGEEFGFSVDQDVLISFQLSKGKKLEDETIDQILYEDQGKKAYHLALNYLSYRMRTVKEVKDYLEKKDIHEKIIASIIEKLKSYQFIDDKEFAKAFVRSRMNSGSKGPSMIKQELRTKGVPVNDLESALKHYSKEEQIKHAKKWIQKQRNKKIRESEQMFIQKVTKQLLSKGFPFEIIEISIQEEKVELSDDDQWEAITYQGDKLSRKYANLEHRELNYKLKQALYRKGFSASLIEQYMNRDMDR